MRFFLPIALFIGAALLAVTVYAQDDADSPTTTRRARTSRRPVRRTTTSRIAECGELPEIANGQILPGPSAFGSRRVVQCNVGYRLISGDFGDSTVYCFDDGHWDTAAQCEQVPTTPPGETTVVVTKKQVIDEVTATYKTIIQPYGTEENNRTILILGIVLGILAVLVIILIILYLLPLCGIRVCT